MEKQSGAASDRMERPTHQVRLPGFLIEEEVGLGDLIKKATYAMGIKPCGGCEQRGGPEPLDDLLSMTLATQTRGTTMVQTEAEAHEQTVNASVLRDDPPAAVAPSVGPAARVISPQGCPTCGTAPAGNGGTATSPSWVYALGNIEARFPTISVEKEFAQATGRDNTSGLTDRQALQTVLSKPENRYLVRQCCFVMTVQGLETYILTPRDPADLGLLVGAIRTNPSPMDLDVVIGMKGSIAPPQMCNGLLVPIVVFDQIYSFDRDALIKAIPRPEKTSAKEFVPRPRKCSTASCRSPTTREPPTSIAP